MLKPTILLRGEFLAFEEQFKQRFQKRQYGRGETILGFGDRRDRYCYYILKGRVSCTYLDEEGHVRTSTLRGAGTIFPLYYTYDRTSIEQTLEFTAFDNVELLVIPKRDLHQMMREDPDLAFAMMDAWGNYATYVLYAFEMQFDTIRKRVCSFLYLHGNGHGRIKATHADIANAIGITRENVSRTLSALRDGGIISLSRGVIVIEDRDRLLEESSYIVGIE